MKTLHFAVSLLLGITCLFSFGCQENNSSASLNDSTDPWPQLLVRNDALSNSIEWEATVKTVNQLSSDLQENPNNPSSLIKLAKVYTNEARVTGEHGYYYPAILSMLDKALEADHITSDERFEALGLRANTLMSQHRFADALVAAERAVSLNPDNPSIYAALVDANVEMGDYPAAVNYAQKLVNIRPDLVSYARASYLRELHGDIPGAIEAMRMAVKAGYPGRENTEWARITLAEMLATYNNMKEAEALYRQSLEVRNDYPFALAGLAKLKMENQEYEKAELLLDQAIAIIPEFSFQEALLMLYKQTGRKDKAHAAYQELLAMLEDDMAHGHIMNLEYAGVLFRHGDAPEKALEFALEDYRERPANIDVNLMLSEIYLALGQDDKARQHLAVAMSTGSQAPEIKSLLQTLATR